MNCKVEIVQQKKFLSPLCPFCAAYPSISAHYTSIYLLRYLSGVSNFNMLWILMCIPSIIVRRVITKSSIQWHRWYHQSQEIAFSSRFFKLFVSKILLFRSTGASCTTFEALRLSIRPKNFSFSFLFSSFFSVFQHPRHHLSPISCPLQNFRVKINLANLSRTIGSCFLFNETIKIDL